MNWYAVYSKPRWEKKMSTLLEKLGYEVYCPMVKTRSRWTDRNVTILKPLFSSYLFLKLSPNQIEEIRQIDGILNFVYSQKKPFNVIAIIKEYEIEAIKDFLTQHENVKVKNLDYKIGDKVTLEHGGFTGHKGTILKIQPNRIELVLETLGAKLVVKIKEIKKVEEKE